ncbi:MAG: hypothetical protein COB78_00285 [Hyphomicrobiales bacterium]|nr:MAG: hypothetical protein COB78_00285 [Hyphomicrobiales bacterium]
MKQPIKTTITVSAISVAMSLAVTASTFAAPTCGTHDLITSTLAAQYNEIPLHRGLTPKGTMVEVFSSKAGTFTVVITIPTGRSCLVTAGTHWQEIDAASHGGDKDTSGVLNREF